MTTYDHSGAADATSLPTVAAAHWLLRAAAAATFIYHGATKFPSLAAGAEAMGYAVPVWTLVALVEVLAGLALLAGAAVPRALGDIVTRLGGLGIAVIMIGAIVTVHWGAWNVMAGGMEFQVLLLATGLFFALRGNRA